MSKYTKICSDHFEYGRPVEPAPNPTLFLKACDDDAKVGVKRKVPTSRKEPPARRKIWRKEPALENKKSQPEKGQLQVITSDSEHHPLSPFSSRKVEKPTRSTFADVSHEKSLKIHERERYGYSHLFSMNWEKVFPYTGKIFPYIPIVSHIWESCRFFNSIDLYTKYGNILVFPIIFP